MQKFNKNGEAKILKTKQKALLMRVQNIASLGRAGIEISAHN